MSWWDRVLGRKPTTVLSHDEVDKVVQGDAPPSQYNPPAGGAPTRPVPMYENADPGGLQEPASDGTIRENNSGTGQPSVQLQEVPAGEWPVAEQPIEQTGLKSSEPEETEEVPSLFAPVP